MSRPLQTTTANNETGCVQFPIEWDCWKIVGERYLAVEAALAVIADVYLNQSAGGTSSVVRHK